MDTDCFLIVGDLLAAQKGALTERLQSAFWQAYGPVLKWAFWGAVVFFFGLPVLGAIKRFLR